MTDADQPYRPSGRLMLVLAVTLLPVSIGLVWIGTMHLDGRPAFLVMMAAFILPLSATMGFTVVHGWRTRLLKRIERPEGGA